MVTEPHAPGLGGGVSEGCLRLPVGDTEVRLLGQVDVPPRDGVVADDEVIESPDVEERERLLEAARDELVGLARPGEAGRV
jgi:hypothetical protein